MRRVVGCLALVVVAVAVGALARGEEEETVWFCDYDPATGEVINLRRGCPHAPGECSCGRPHWDVTPGFQRRVLTEAEALEIQRPDEEALVQQWIEYGRKAAALKAALAECPEDSPIRAVLADRLKSLATPPGKPRETWKEILK